MRRAVLAVAGIAVACVVPVLFSYTLGGLLTWIGSSLSDASGTESDWSVGPFAGDTTTGAFVVAAGFALATVAALVGCVALLRRAFGRSHDASSGRRPTSRPG